MKTATIIIATCVALAGLAQAEPTNITMQVTAKEQKLILSHRIPVAERIAAARAKLPADLRAKIEQQEADNKVEAARLATLTPAEREAAMRIREKQRAEADLARANAALGKLDKAVVEKATAAVPPVALPVKPVVIAR